MHGKLGRLGIDFCKRDWGRMFEGMANHVATRFWTN
jgi:hypothetical protein